MKTYFFRLHKVSQLSSLLTSPYYPYLKKLCISINSILKIKVFGSNWPHVEVNRSMDNDGNLIYDGGRWWLLPTVMVHVSGTNGEQMDQLKKLLSLGTMKAIADYPN